MYWIISEKWIEMALHFLEITILVKYSWMILMFAEVLTELVVVDCIDFSGPWFYMKPELHGLQNTFLCNCELSAETLKD